MNNTSVIPYSEDAKITMCILANGVGSITMETLDLAKDIYSNIESLEKRYITVIKPSIPINSETKEPMASLETDLGNKMIDLKRLLTDINGYILNITSRCGL